MAMTEAKRWGFEGRTLAILTLCKASRAPGGTGFALQNHGDETRGSKGSRQPSTDSGVQAGGKQHQVSKLGPSLTPCCVVQGKKASLMVCGYS